MYYTAIVNDCRKLSSAPFRFGCPQFPSDLFAQSTPASDPRPPTCSDESDTDASSVRRSLETTRRTVGIPIVVRSFLLVLFSVACGRSILRRHICNTSFCLTASDARGRVTQTTLPNKAAVKQLTPPRLARHELHRLSANQTGNGGTGGIRLGADIDAVRRHSGGYGRGCLKIAHNRSVSRLGHGLGHYRTLRGAGDGRQRQHQYKEEGYSHFDNSLKSSLHTSGDNTNLISVTTPSPDNTFNRRINPRLSSSMTVILRMSACCRTRSLLSALLIGLDNVGIIGIEFGVFPVFGDCSNGCAFASVFSTDDNGRVLSV